MIAMKIMRASGLYSDFDELEPAMSKLKIMDFLFNARHFNREITV
ncbi:hypothetical protein [Caballeronia sordidicola]|nr:hypothetical protein [Caballeronia sordidicola]